MQSAYVALVYVVLLALGLTAPFTFSLAYIWVDLSGPQNVSALLSTVPVSMICAVGAIGAFVVTLGSKPLHLTLTIWLTLVMAVWITLTTTWAVAPIAAWAKWDWAFKTVLFSAILPLIFTTRAQIEAFLQTYVFSVAVVIVPYGIKTFVSGGGYGRALSVGAYDSGIAESSTLAAISIMCIPILSALRRHSILLPWPHVRNAIYWGYIGICLFTAVGTYARTGLIAMIVLAIIGILRSKRKMVAIVLLSLVVAIGVSLTADGWRERMSTVETYDTEGSALGRILVWKWTLDFAIDNPLGGGFNSYLTNTITFPPAPGQTEGVVIHGKAFHNIFIEVLGEHGWFGLAIFVAIIGSSALQLWQTSRRAKRDKRLAWCGDMATALLASLIILTVSGNFVGIAFQPTFWYLFAVSSSVATYARGVARSEAVAPAEDDPAATRLAANVPPGRGRRAVSAWP